LPRCRPPYRARRYLYHRNSLGAIIGAQSAERHPPPKPSVQLQPPSLSAHEPRGPQEPQSNASQQPTTSDQRGTDQVPLTVKVLPTPKSQADIEDEKHRADEHAANERGLATATWVLAGFTLLLAASLFLQDHFRRIDIESLLPLRMSGELAHE
jgi:hypothetical protein